MDYAIHANRVRCLVVWLGVTAASVLVVGALLPLEASLSGSFDELLVRLSSWALLGCAAWFWLVTTAVIAAAVRGSLHGSRATALRGVPAPVRRLVLLACGLALTGGMGAPALATPGPVHLGQRDHSGRVVLTGLPYPDRATVQAFRVLRRSAATDPPRHAHAHAGPHVVVRDGDSLWSLAAARLPADAGNAEIAAAWHRLYARNRPVVGDDPDLLIPGQHLLLPPVIG